MEKITHEGIVEKIEPGRVFVKIEAKSACANCHAKGACTSLDKSSKIIEAYSDDSISVGDKVLVEITSSLGLLAVLFAFIIPFIILFVTLLVVYYFTKNEIFAALTSFLPVFIYFVIFYFLKDKMSRIFVVKARKI